MGLELQELITETKIFITDYYVKNYDERFTYHNLDHVLDTVQQVIFMSDYYNIDSYFKENLIISAYFHDSGMNLSITNHEVESSKLVEKFLSKKLPDDRIAEIQKLILATRLEAVKEDYFAEILSDADLSYLGRDNFIEISSNLRKEWEYTLNLLLSDREWNERNLIFLKTHRFRSTYAKKFYQKTKLKNQALIVEKMLQLI